MEGICSEPTQSHFDPKDERKTQYVPKDHWVGKALRENSEKGRRWWGSQLDIHMNDQAIKGNKNAFPIYMYVV